MIERKIYPGYAFKENENEKARINSEIYDELRQKYRVMKYLIGRVIDCDLDDYDVVISRTPGYNHSEYTVIKNSPGLTLTELALICDDGNLCFGYAMRGKKIHVFED